jgi:hypothetical protein
MITITVSGQSYSYDVTEGDLEGLEIARARVMEQLPVGEGQDQDTAISKRPGFIADGVDYLQKIVSDYCERTDEDPQEVMERCLRSWTTDEPVVEEAPEEE